MIALEYSPSPARHLAARVSPRAGTGALRLTEMRPPRLPGRDWTLVTPRLAGICGSDQALVDGTASPLLGALTSAPFVPGHEVVGDVRTDGGGTQRVVIEPALGCVARALEPLCPECAAGRHALCRRVIDGPVGAGLQVGYCRATGGGWSERVAVHRSQLHAVPDDLTDEDAVLVEPLACALHAAARAEPADGERIAVIGAGTVGLLVVAALRKLAPAAMVLAVAKHSAQAHAARRLGADHSCAPNALAVEAGRLSGGRRLVGRIGGELLLGGFDAVLDCVGSGATLQAAISVTRPRGRVVMVGMPGSVSLDMALAWQREIELRGAYGYEADFAAAIELARRLHPGRLVGDGFRLREFRRALERAPAGAREGKVKTVFDMREGHE